MKIELPKKLKPKFIYIGLAVAVAIAALYLGRSLLFAAFVNGQPIFRLSVLSQLEKEGGGSVLKNLVDKALISQEARKSNLSVSQETISQELARIENVLKEQSLSLEQALSQQGQTKESLVEQIRLQKLVEAILGDKIQITDAEINDYFTQNKDLFDKEKKLEDVKEEIKQKIFQQKLIAEYQKWIEELRSKAKIFYFVNY